MRNCICTSARNRQDRDCLGRPLLDRINLNTEVARLPVDELNSHSHRESSAEARHRVIALQKIQPRRFESQQGIHLKPKWGSGCCCAMPTPMRGGARWCAMWQITEAIGYRVLDRQDPAG